MSKEFPNRTHGDGRLIIDSSFYTPISEEETPQYLKLLTDIIGRAQIPMTIDLQDSKLPNTLLALKQRFIIGFSNGCPWPEKAINEHLLDQKTPPTTLDELTVQIKESAHLDGKRSFLFHTLLQYASEPLKDELLGYHPWQQLDGQEDRNLPQDITDPNGKGAYGLAYDPPYFDVLIPLYKFIDDDKNIGTHQIRYFAVSDFLEEVGKRTKSIEELIKQTKEFLFNPQTYLEAYLSELK